MSNIMTLESARRASSLFSRNASLKASVGDVGASLNTTSPAGPFIHGLNGVNQTGNYLYGDIVSKALSAILVIALLVNLLRCISHWFRLSMTLSPEIDHRHWQSNLSSSWAWIKRHLILAPLFRHRHNHEIQLSRAIAIGTLPSRLHTILLIIVLGFNLLALLVLDWSRPDAYSVIAELRGRSGHLATLQLIPTVLFALRNNPLIDLLGTSYDTMNLLHRWFARMVVAESMLHVLCWLINNISAGGTQQVQLSLVTSASFQGGTVAAIAFLVIAMVSVGPVRHAFYETFLAGHRVLVLMALVGIYLHLHLGDLPQRPFAIVTGILWCAEYIFRLARILYHNVDRQHGLTKVTVQALPAEACRLTFELKRSWRWRPGCWTHIYLPQIELGTSHPFSVAWGDKSPSKAVELVKMLEAEELSSGERCQADYGPVTEKKSIHCILNSEKNRAHPFQGDDKQTLISNVTSISCVVRARTGMTRKLYDKAMAQGDSFAARTFVTTALVEGPYGGTYNLDSYGTIVLFAGGIGITHAISFVRDLLLRHHNNVSSTRKIVLIWSIPNTEATAWIHPWMDQILRMDNRKELLQVRIFVTKPRHRREVVSQTGSVQLYPGRCNPRTIMEREMTERVGAMAVTMCGPGVFADAVRAGVREFVEEGVVDFVEDAFTY